MISIGEKKIYLFGLFASMGVWCRIKVGRDGLWAENHPSPVDDKVDPENFYLESHNIVPRPQSAIAMTGILSRLALLLACFARRNNCYYSYQRFLHTNEAKGSFPLYWPNSLVTFQRPPYKKMLPTTATVSLLWIIVPVAGSVAVKGALFIHMAGLVGELNSKILQY